MKKTKKDPSRNNYSTFSIVPVLIKQIHDKNDCAIASLLPYQVWMDSDITNEILFNKIARKVAEIDTQSNLFLKSKNIKRCKNCEGPQLSDSVYEYMNEYGKRVGSGKTPVLNNGAGSDATQFVQWWQPYTVGFEWSEAQQLQISTVSKVINLFLKNCRYDPEKSLQIMLVCWKALKTKPKSSLGNFIHSDFACRLLVKD